MSDFRMFQKVFSLPAKRLMELGKGKTSVTHLCNGFCVHIVCLKVLFPGLIKGQEQFIIEILYSILEHFCIFSKIFLKLFQKNKGRFRKPKKVSLQTRFPVMQKRAQGRTLCSGSVCQGSAVYFPEKRNCSAKESQRRHRTDRLLLFRIQFLLLQWKIFLRTERR